MKRFYCTICQKVKRVQILPENVTPHKNPTIRIGECRFHGEIGTRDQINHRGRIRTPYVKSHKLSAAAARSKSKKG